MDELEGKDKEENGCEDELDASSSSAQHFAKKKAASRTMQCSMELLT